VELSTSGTFKVRDPNDRISKFKDSSFTPLYVISFREMICWMYLPKF
jgi:hypothetical protein